MAKYVIKFAPSNIKIAHTASSSAGHFYCIFKICGVKFLIRCAHKNFLPGLATRRARNGAPRIAPPHLG
jgi:hypothetical protein